MTNPTQEMSVQDCSGLSLESEICRAGQAGWKLRQGFSITVLRLNSFFSKKLQFLLLRLSFDFMRPTLILRVTSFIHSQLIKY